jgi:hypothetical protein
MQDDDSILPPPKRTPCNKRNLIGAKPPPPARQVWSPKLRIEKRTRGRMPHEAALGRCTNSRQCRCGWRASPRPLHGSLYNLSLSQLCSQCV